MCHIRHANQNVVQEKKSQAPFLFRVCPERPKFDLQYLRNYKSELRKLGVVGSVLKSSLLKH